MSLERQKRSDVNHHILAPITAFDEVELAQQLKKQSHLLDGSNLLLQDKKKLSPAPLSQGWVASSQSGGKDSNGSSQRRSKNYPSHRKHRLSTIKSGDLMMEDNDSQGAPCNTM